MILNSCSGNSVNSPMNFTSAYLGVRIYSGSSYDTTIEMFGLYDDIWDENTVTWNTRPDIDLRISLGSQAMFGTVDEWYFWDITDYEKSQQDGWMTIIAEDIDIDDDYSYFYSREYNDGEFSPRIYYNGNITNMDIIERPLTSTETVISNETVTDTQTEMITETITGNETITNTHTESITYTNYNTTTVTDSPTVFTEFNTTIINTIDKIETETTVITNLKSEVNFPIIFSVLLIAIIPIVRKQRYQSK